MIDFENEKQYDNNLLQKRKEMMNNENKIEKIRKIKDKEDDANSLCMGKPSGPLNKLGGKPDFRISYSTSAIYRANIAHPV